jgi:hypothetical protein
VCPSPHKDDRTFNEERAVIIAYLTTDEVNQHLAQQFATEYGAGLEVVWPRDALPDSRFDAVLYDLDCLPPAEREQLLAGLLAGPAPRPGAVHSYNLTEPQIETLRANGVRIYRSLAREVFQALAGPAARHFDSAEPHGTLGDREHLAALLS